MSEFTKGDYVVYTDEFGDGHYGRVAFVDEHGMVHVCFTTGCIARRRKPEWLRKVEPRPWMEQVGFGQPRLCHMNHVLLYDEEAVDGIECDECFYTEVHSLDDPLPDRCPGCGAKVVG